jgi:hypothetical protein
VNTQPKQDHRRRASTATPMGQVPARGLKLLFCFALFRHLHCSDYVLAHAVATRCVEFEGLGRGDSRSGIESLPQPWAW